MSPRDVEERQPVKPRWARGQSDSEDDIDRDWCVHVHHAGLVTAGGLPTLLTTRIAEAAWDLRPKPPCVRRAGGMTRSQVIAAFSGVPISLSDLLRVGNCPDGTWHK